MHEDEPSSGEPGRLPASPPEGEAGGGGESAARAGREAGEAAEAARARREARQRMAVRLKLAFEVRCGPSLPSMDAFVALGLP